MTEFWQDLIKSLGGLAILACALAWLVRSLISHFLLKDIEAYKTSLKFETSREIENLKTRLQIVAKEHDVRFSTLHEKRAEVIAELYHLMEQADVSASLFERALKLRDDGRVDDDKAKRFADTAREEWQTLFDFVQRHQLYFSKDLAIAMQQLVSEIQKPTVQFALESGGHDQLIEHWEKNRDQVRQTLQLIETEFRRMLGSDK